MSNNEFSHPLEANCQWNTSEKKKIPVLNKDSLFRWKRKYSSNFSVPESQISEKRQKITTLNNQNDNIVIDKTDDESNAVFNIIDEKSSIKKEFQNQKSILKKESFNANVNFNTCIKTKADHSKLKHYTHPPGMPSLISGISVQFPKTPYKSQISLMNAVIKGCKSHEHCLLESPTGSGKTLALLCAALAWQDHHKQTLLENMHNFSQEHGTSDPRFLSSNKDGAELMEEKRPDMPKIYYGSRTHRQIEQVIREFRKTSYSHKLMTILSSREYTCIQSPRKGMNKTQICHELLDPLTVGACKYYPDNSKTNWGSFVHMDTPWDIEDLVQLGKNKELCPYFTARNLMLTAEIIFCPYNYLVDPFIRETMKINLNGHIVIMDEAHNIEDVCRNIGSMEFREDSLAEVIEDCRLVGHLSQDMLVYSCLENYLFSLLTLLREQQLSVSSDKYEDTPSSFWSGPEAWILFKIRKLADNKYIEFTKSAAVAIAIYNDAREAPSSINSHVGSTTMKPSIKYATKDLLEKLLVSLKYIQDSKTSDDYRCIINESYCQDAKVKVEENTWITGHQIKRLRILKFMCMNPAVIFNQLTSKARSVILASGTLSPISSFESELGTKFAHKLHTSHVVTKDQVFVRGIARGPQGTVLKATYSNVHTLSFKDDLGRLIVDICQVVPHGILCFFSSYSMLTSQIERWKETVIWKDIESCKFIFKEPRSNSDLIEVMQQFRSAIQNTNCRTYNGITGGILFAVFRGKVAEGIDFSDNEARCVITVGIPYAVQRDPVVKLKREYNDIHLKKGLVTGSEWYSIQAYRALNQALGRCIRHRYDWGAILLVDERLASSSVNSYLPKWIKEMRLEDQDYNLKEDLKIFVSKQKSKDKERT